MQRRPLTAAVAALTLLAIAPAGEAEATSHFVGTTSITGGQVAFQCGDSCDDPATTVCDTADAVLRSLWTWTEPRSFGPGQLRKAEFVLQAVSVADGSRLVTSQQETMAQPGSRSASAPLELQLPRPVAGQAFEVSMVGRFWENGEGEPTVEESSEPQLVVSIRCPDADLLTVQPTTMGTTGLIDGQKGQVTLVVTNGGLGYSVVEVAPAQAEGACSITGGPTQPTTAGKHAFVIGPASLPPQSPLPRGKIALDYAFQGTEPGNCIISMDVISYASDGGLPDVIPVEHVVDVLADIGGTPASLGTMIGTGGTFEWDTMEGTEPEVKEYTLVTPADKTLQIVTATIGWDDGVDYADYGKFDITPVPDQVLLKQILPFVTVEAPTWTTTISDEGGNQAQWLTIVAVDAAKRSTSAPDGKANQACIAGYYYEDLDSIDSEDKVCITIYGVQEDTATVAAVAALHGVAVSRVGGVLLPGHPSLYGLALQPYEDQVGPALPSL